MHQESESIDMKKNPKLQLLGMVPLAILIFVFNLVGGGCSQDQSSTIVATATPTPSTYPFSSTLILDDSLTDTKSTPAWAQHQNSSGNDCFFSGNAYHATQNTPNHYHACAAQKTNYSNFTFEIGITIKRGDNDAKGGVFFRGASQNAQFYGLFIDPQGNYTLFVSPGSNSSDEELASGNAPPSFTRGLNQHNTVGVVVMGNKISLYINRQHVTDAEDEKSYYNSGQVGVLVSSKSKATEVAYTDAKVWQLPD